MTQIAFDIDKDLHHKICEAARTNGKNVEVEIIDRLEASFFASEATAMLRTAVRILKQRIIAKDKQIQTQGTSIELLHKMQAMYASSIENFFQLLLNTEDEIGVQLRKVAIEAIAIGFTCMELPEEAKS